MPVTDRQRRDDDPTLDFREGTPYARYGGIDTLLSLQHPRTAQPAETGFLITTQVMELLFKLLAHEWTQARDALEDDQVPTALAALRRSSRAQEVLVDSWDLLAALTPGEFAAFRDGLGEASGVQSGTYRELEFLLGNKSAAMLRPHRDSPGTLARLRAVLAEPSLYDASLRLLSRRGVAVPHDHVARDWTQPYESDPGVEAAWATVYAEESPDNDASQLAELLVDTAERVTRWRQRHLLVVRRSLGAKPGTGGSSGVEWLRRNAERDVFPELWSLRNTM
ncbi:tryptophan 2,3-dioxygenase [Spiractinospora alimapuensis]|uniref:tryptophan 2,3-dioxygenase n=1 Tax=Spiractinospora alimapuensis TaxID=2820884 RepID=UPI001F2A6ABF|nr:tryptophan 2,3-dioxygenase family protein [Spiractinospora alimapuensis]QVQ52022.1 tryptophan 2,3-dioxygenase [Spiractinospora alimapuensis]